MMKTFRADLHIHTCLSHCAELEMTPKNIVAESLRKGLDIIGICDHNSCENVAYVKRSARDEYLYIIGGIEVTSREEVHVLALFGDERSLLSMQQTIYEHIKDTMEEKIFSEQIIVNEADEVIDFNKKLLIGATDLSIESIVNKIHELNGIAIASHIDRERFSVISQLGFIPGELKLDAVEISDKNKFRFYSHYAYPIVSFSDAHNLDDIGKNCLNFSMEHLSFDEMKRSINGEDGRKIYL